MAHRHTTHLAAFLPLLIWSCQGHTGEAQGVEPISVEGGKGAYAVTLPDGRLMMWWTDGRAELDPALFRSPDTPQRAYARYSSDSGRTWSEPQLLFEFPRGDGMYAGQVMLVDRAQNIHLFGLQVFTYDLQNLDNWDGWESYAFHVMSSDGGTTWTAPRRCDFGYKYTGMTNSVVQLRSGRILLPVSYYSRRKTGRFVSNCSLSDDGGETWRPSKGECVVDTGGGGIESGAIEPVVAELTDGRVWMLMRTQGGYLYESFSSDGGDTWTAPAPTRFVSSNSPAAFLRLRDGRLVLVWQNAMGPGPISYDRQVLAGAISSDEGKTWRGYRQIARVAQQDPQGQAAYPFLTQTADGAVFVAYYNASWSPLFCRVNPDWLTETAQKDDFSNGLADWMTIGTEGVAAVPHPDRPGAQVLALRKAKAETPAGASCNFPFGVKGRLTMRVRLQPGFRGARVCLTDFFSMPGAREDGRFGADIAADGTLAGSIARLTPGRWHTLSLAWDCAGRTCAVSVDYRKVADLPPLSKAVGLCYLRLWSAAPQTDEAGLIVESVRTVSAP